MTIIHSITAKNEMMKDATIEWLKEDLQNALDLIQAYKAAVNEERVETQAVKTEAKLVAMQCMDLIAKGDYFMARAHLQVLFNTMS